MRCDARILIASDSSADAAVVEKLIADDYEKIFFSTDPQKAVIDFEQHKPNILILAFNGLEKAERYYLGLYRLSPVVHLQPHRTLILCNKDELRRIYDLCCKDYFDDYILFWPAPNDAYRLPIAVRHALRDLESVEVGKPALKMAAQARRIAELEVLLRGRLTEGSEHVELAARRVQEAETEIDAAIDNFSKKVTESGLAGALDANGAARVQQEISRLKVEEIGQRLRGLEEAVQPLGRWVGDLRREVAPHMEAARTLQTLSEGMRPLVLAVDDDDLQRKMLARVLRSEHYQLAFAASGNEALGLLRKRRPDIILLDFEMPDMSGLDVLRRLKAIPQFASIPVVMVTGQSNRTAVSESLKAGAVDFVVKPPNREILLRKIGQHLA